MSSERIIYPVSTLAGEIRRLMEASYRSVWIQGEIASLSRPASGHLYFSLKEGDCVLRCAFFRNRQRGSRVDLSEGMEVLLQGQVSFYEARGDLQCIVHYAEQAGEGALRRAFEKLKQKLAAEGLFDSDRKAELPAYPRRIGIITSPSGAALHDILTTLKRRCPYLGVVIYPTAVQGAEAPAGIVKALEIASERRETEVLLLARGGGSMEDLQAFNEESVARAIAACDLPVITGVGHETDFTIADFVSDYRAPTPTGAAEIVAPDSDTLRASFNALADRLLAETGYRLRHGQQRLDLLTTRLVHPHNYLQRERDRHHFLHRQLVNLARARQQQAAQTLDGLSAVLRAHSPARSLAQTADRIHTSRLRLQRITRDSLRLHRNRLRDLESRVNLLGPQNTLERGYAIVQDAGGRVVARADSVGAGDELAIRVSRGRIAARVIDAKN